MSLVAPTSTPTPGPDPPSPDPPTPVSPTPTPTPKPADPPSPSSPISPPPPTPTDPPPPSNPSPPLPPGTPLPPPPPPEILSPPSPYVPPPPPSSSSVSVGMIAGIGVGAVVAAALLVGLFIVILWRRPRRRDNPHHSIYAPSPSPFPSVKPYSQHQGPTSVFLSSQAPPPSSRSWQDDDNPRSRPSPSSENPPLSSVPPPAVAGGPFKYEDLASATNGFAEWNVLGQGGFGLVYRGTLRGNDVAIKKLKSGSRQGEKEFRAEVEIISRVHHKNLVSLVGHCIHEDQRLLVYEYVPNKTLAFHLHGNGRPTLDWKKRWTIALGSARALAYLHEDC